MNTIPTRESDFAGRSGSTVIIHRYGQDDYSAWFTDNPNDDTSGCSVRGTLLDILEECRDEVPARKITDNSERLETICEFIEAFEDFLDEKGIVIPNDEKDQDPDASNIYGTDYGNLESRLDDLLVRLGMMEKEDK